MWVCLVLRGCCPTFCTGAEHYPQPPLPPFPSGRGDFSCCALRALFVGLRPASSQSPFMLGAVGKRPPLTSLPCSSFSAKRHAKVACSVVNALTTALFCYHLFAVLRAGARYFCGASPHTLLRGASPLKTPVVFLLWVQAVVPPIQ